MPSKEAAVEIPTATEEFKHAKHIRTSLRCLLLLGSKVYALYIMLQYDWILSDSYCKLRAHAHTITSEGSILGIATTH
jgi:hypothetical protein